MIGGRPKDLDLIQSETNAGKTPMKTDVGNGGRSGSTTVRPSSGRMGDA